MSYPDALMIQGSIGAPQDHHHQDEGITDGVKLMVFKVNTTIDALSALTVFHEHKNPEWYHLTHKYLLGPNYPKERSLTAPTRLLKHDSQDRHHNLGASTVITIFYKLEALEYHSHTCKHLILGLNHLNGQTSITPRLTYPHQHVTPECYHPTLTRPIHHLLSKYKAPEYLNTVCSLINHLLFKHDTPERHHTMGSLIHHLHE